ncbi:MAG TPA: hypothetical protein VLF14_09670 [Candidatus Binatia bacterium]|nr:hypothetical protein [Candidatus Binatia bacterium]
MFVLPEQIITPTRLKLNGVRHLMAAVLIDGVESFCKTLGSVDRRKQALHDETSAWIFSDDRSGVFSFLNLCEALDVDPDAVREGLTKWQRDHGRKIAAANPGLGWIARLLALA